MVWFLQPFLYIDIQPFKFGSSKKVQASFHEAEGSVLSSTSLKHVLQEWIWGRGEPGAQLSPEITLWYSSKKN